MTNDGNGLIKFLSFDRLLLLVVITFQLGVWINSTEASGAGLDNRLGGLEARVTRTEVIQGELSRLAAKTGEWQDQVIERLRAIEQEVRRRP